MDTTISEMTDRQVAAALRPLLRKGGSFRGACETRGFPFWITRNRLIKAGLYGPLMKCKYDSWSNREKAEEGR